jgi:hypothetical protein
VLVIFNINPLAKFSYSCLISLGLGLGVVTSDSTRTSPVIHIDDEPRPHQLQQHSYAIWETRVLGWGPPKISLKIDTLSSSVAYYSRQQHYTTKVGWTSHPAPSS